jgi:hypothetical protein
MALDRVPNVFDAATYFHQPLRHWFAGLSLNLQSATDPTGGQNGVTLG